MAVSISSPRMANSSDKGTPIRIPLSSANLLWASEIWKKKKKYSGNSFNSTQFKKILLVHNSMYKPLQSLTLCTKGHYEITVSAVLCGL